MYRFINNVAVDLLLWTMIYFGLYLHIEWVENVAIAYLWFGAILLMLTGMLSGNKTFIDSMKKKGKRLWIHKQWIRVTCVGECAALFALGYFWLGGFYALGCLFAQAVYIELEK